MLQQVRTGEWTNVHTTIFTAWVHITTLGGSTPSLLTLSQAVILGLALLALTRTIFPGRTRNVLRRAVLLVFALSPSFGGFSMMAWKDVPYAAGALFVTAGLLKIPRRTHLAPQERRYTYFLLITGAFLLAGFRWNGSLTVFLIAIVFALLVRPLHKTALVLLLVVMCAGASSLLIPERVGLVEGPTWLQLNSRRLHDIAVGVSDGSFVTDSEQRMRLESVMPISNWKIAGNDCSTHDEMMFSEFSRLEEAERENLRQVLPIWDVILSQHPMTIVKSRACKLLPSLLPVQLGPTRPLALWSRPNIDPELAQPDHLGTVSDLVEGIVDRSNTAPWLNWSLFRTPIWLVLNTVLAGWVYHRRRLHRDHVLVVAVAVSIQLSAGLVAYAQDFRYTTGALLLLQLNAVKMLSDGVTPRTESDSISAPS